MFKNYFKIAFRNLQRQKVYSLINITGLAFGMMCTILISLWIMDELSYDKFHSNINTIYRVNSVLHRSNIVVEQHQTPSPLAGQLISTFPEIKNVTRFRKSELLFQYQSKAFQEKNAVFAEPSFFEMFTFPLLKGDPKTALSDVNSMVISESMSEKYFGQEESIGKTFIINGKYEFRITGIVKDSPDNSTIKFDFLLSYNSIDDFFSDLSWDNFIINTYILGSSCEFVHPIWHI
ncbi:ABC transporter permease [bacterium]|nr:ABC transporter permease [bacterium]RQV94749.1 MAG: hypothetical protein EH221_07220 [bacterium]